MALFQSYLFRLAPAVLAAAILAGCASPVKAPATSQPPAAQAPAAQMPAASLPAPAPAAEPPPLRLPPPVEPPPLTLQPPPVDGAVRVALLVPLSGQAGAVGRALMEAAHLALIDAGNPDVVLLPRDTEGRADKAADLARQAMAEGAGMILGPLFAAEVQAVGAVARPMGVPVIGFSTDRSVAGDGVYLLGFSPEEQVSRVVRYAAEKGLGPMAALTPESAYGNAVLAAFRKAAEEGGAQIDRVETYAPEAPDLTATVKRLGDYDRRKQELVKFRRELAAKGDDESKLQLRRLEKVDTLGEVDYKALLLAEGGAKLRSLAPLLPYYDIDPKEVRFLGTGLWDEPGLGTEPALVGGWYAASPPELVEAFAKRYEQVYGRRPIRIASLGYDAVALTALLAKRKDAARFGREALGNPDGFAGYNGIFRFGAAGTVERGLAILEIGPRSAVRVIEPAPQSFQAVTQ